MITIAEQIQHLVDNEVITDSKIVSFLIGVLDGHQYLIEKQEARIEALEKKLAQLELEQKINRAAMPFGGGVERGPVNHRRAFPIPQPPSSPLHNANSTTPRQSPDEAVIFDKPGSDAQEVAFSF